MSEKDAWKHFEDTCAAEEKRIRKVTCPAERARQYAWLDKWKKDEQSTIKMLARHQEDTIADQYEESQHV